MSTDQNLNKAAKLTDIPLSVDQAGDAKPHDEKLAAKTNSLRRFLRMPSKRGIEVVSTNELPTTNDLAGENSEMDGTAAELDKKPKEKGGGHMRRFHLRLGGLQKRGTSPTDFEAGSSSVVTQNTKSGNLKSGLKSSLSNYWNQVFKRHHGDKHAKNQNEPIDDDDVDDDIDETELREEVHTLAISEEEDPAKSK